MKKDRFIAAAALVSLALFAAYKLIPGAGGAGGNVERGAIGDPVNPVGAAGAAVADGATDPDMLKAARLMDDAIRAVRGCAETARGGIDARTDINRTGFIGLENSVITTSLGHLEAKRTAANPNFAAAVVRMLKQAGVGRGDAVAVGASGSFPALAAASRFHSGSVKRAGSRPLAGRPGAGAAQPSVAAEAMPDLLEGLLKKVRE